MGRITRTVKKRWTAVLVRRHRKVQERSARVDRDAAERLDQLSQGIQSYGRPGPTGW